MENLSKNRTKVQNCFDQEFEKHNLQNATPPSLHDRFTSQGYKKFDENRFLNFFLLYMQFWHFEIQFGFIIGKFVFEPFWGPTLFKVSGV